MAEQNRKKSEEELSRVTGERAQHKGVEGNLPGNEKSLTSNENRDKGMASLDEQEKSRIARETELKRKDISDLEDTGGLSGRDDLAGGPNTDMSNIEKDDVR